MCFYIRPCLCYIRGMKNFTILLPLLLVSTALADTSMSRSDRVEINSLSLKYSGKKCKGDYELEIENRDNKLSPAQIKEARTKLYKEWQKELAEDAREEGFKYKVGYNHNQVWYWTKKGNEGTFKIVKLMNNLEKEMSCEL